MDEGFHYMVPKGLKIFFFSVFFFQKEAPLLKEVEQERMLRHEAEKRLKDMTSESENCQARLQSLQGEFKK